MRFCLHALQVNFHVKHSTGCHTFPTCSNKANVAIIYTADITHKNQFCMASYHIWDEMASFAIVVQIIFFYYFYSYHCTVHSDIHTVHSPTDAHLLKLW